MELLSSQQLYIMQIQSLSLLLFGANYDPTLAAKHLLLTLSGINYSQNYLQKPKNFFINKVKVNLPQKSGPEMKTLFLDLDETLVHCCAPGEQPQFYLNYQSPSGGIIQEGIQVRPFCREALIQLKKCYDIYIFSAGASCYCDAVVNQILDPTNELISGILSRDYCLQTKNGYFIKDLRIIQNRELNEMIIVDNLSHSFGFQLENGIPIMSWYGDSRDQELLFIAEYLIQLATFKEMIQINKQKFQLENIAKLFAQYIEMNK